jgi:hypothetical protein
MNRSEQPCRSGCRVLADWQFRQSLPRHHSPQTIATHGEPPLIRDLVKRTPQTILIVFCLLPGFSALAEHQTYLRGIVNVPGSQVALLEIQHTLLRRSNAPPVITTTSELARSGQQFEDKTIKGEHFQFDVLEIDFPTQTVKTREAGAEHSYTLSRGTRPPAAGNWLQLQDAAFKDVIDLYSQLAGRIVLLHPAVERASVSLAADWTTQVPQPAEITDVFNKYFNARGASVILDGDKLVQLVPSRMSQAASPRSKELPAGTAEIGAMNLENADLGALIGWYGSYSGRSRVGSAPLGGSVPYLRVSQALTRPEVLYVLETLLRWNDARVVLGEGNTFSIERAQP